jgi:hypothetical protein
MGSRWGRDLQPRIPRNLRAGDAGDGGDGILRTSPRFPLPLSPSPFRPIEMWRERRKSVPSVPKANFPAFHGVPNAVRMPSPCRPRDGPESGPVLSTAGPARPVRPSSSTLTPTERRKVAARRSFATATTRS